jgi:hypothetical protein
MYLDNNKGLIVCLDNTILVKKQKVKVQSLNN